MAIASKGFNYLRFRVVVAPAAAVGNIFEEILV